MIDSTSGAIDFQTVAVPVNPSLTRDAFLRHSTGHSVLIENEPWCSFRLPPQELGGERFGIVLYFKGESIESVELCYSSADDVESWSDWSKDKELQRKAFHDAWLKRHGFDCDSYNWGTLYSDFDAKSGASVIIFRYN